MPACLGDGGVVVLSVVLLVLSSLVAVMVVLTLVGCATAATEAFLTSGKKEDD